MTGLDPVDIGGGGECGAGIHGVFAVREDGVAFRDLISSRDRERLERGEGWGGFFYLFWPLLGFVSRTRTDDGGEKRELFFPESKSGVSPAVVSRQSFYSFLSLFVFVKWL